MISASPSSPLRRFGPLGAVRVLWVPRHTHPTQREALKLAGPTAAVLVCDAEVAVRATPPLCCEVAPRVGAAGGITVAERAA
jgi:hypothetical protein